MATTILNKLLNTEGSKYPKDFQNLIDLMGGGQALGANGEDFVWRAYQFGKKAHQGQLRKSGEPYFTHCVEVAGILADMKLDPVTVSAALLHDVIEDTGYTHKDVEQEFSEEVARLVDGVTKLSDMKFRSEEDKQAVGRARRVQRFLSQPFHVAEQFTGIPGVLVDIKDTIKGFNMIMDGELDHLPEAAFNLKGTIEEVIEAGEKMLAEA